MNAAQNTSRNTEDLLLKLEEHSECIPSITAKQSPRGSLGWHGKWLPENTKLLVKTGSAKTKTKTEVFETKTKTANGSIKQNAQFTQKLLLSKTSKTLIDVKFTTEYCI